MNVLAINAGSSSLKYQVLEVTGAHAAARDKGSVERIGSETSHGAAAEQVFRRCAGMGIDAIAYRVVHGGERFLGPARITPGVIEEIRALTELAPLHNGAALACIEAGMRVMPRTPAVAVFDTSFHRTMPEVAGRYAIPRELANRHHLHRFGFHGISHRYVSQQLIEQTGAKRIITAHLGNGSSVCAILEGKSIDTSMGLTPLEGLIMGTRSGDVDPGLVLHLMIALKMSAGEVDGLLNHRSGLLGWSGRSGDMRDLEAAAAGGDALAEGAIEAFAYRCRKYIGAYAAALGGVDAIAFAGGIGEHSPGVRSRIVRGLEFLGIALDEQGNRAAKGDRAQPIGAGKTAVWVIPTDEEKQSALETARLLEGR